MEKQDKNLVNIRIPAFCDATTNPIQYTGKTLFLNTIKGKIGYIFHFLFFRRRIK